MKKLALLLGFVCLFSFAGCQKDYVPNPQVESYLNSENINATKAFDAIAKASFTTTTTYTDKQENPLGKQITTVSFDKSDLNNLLLQVSYEYYGTFINNGIDKKTELVTKKEVGEGYTHTITTVTSGKEETTTKDLDAETVLKLVTMQVYKNNSAYNEGGLYFGDFFSLNIYRYPAEAFYVDEENNLCVFDVELITNRTDLGLGTVDMFQTIKINEWGLITYSYEKYVGHDQDFIMTAIVTPEYTYMKVDA